MKTNQLFIIILLITSEIGISSLAEAALPTPCDILFGSFSSIKNMFKAKNVNMGNPVDRFIWKSGEEPPHFRANYIRTIADLKPGTKIAPFSIVDFILEGTAVKVGHEAWSIKNDVIRMNDDFDSQLVNVAFANGSVEVMQDRGFDSAGNLLSTGWVVSGTSRNISPEAAEVAFDSVGGRPYLVEVAHVHPVWEVSFTEPGGRSLRLNAPLSAPDHELTALLSSQTSSYIRIKAILPNGYSYIATYLHGQRVADPLVHVPPPEYAKKVSQEHMVNTNTMESFRHHILSAIDKIQVDNFKKGQPFKIPLDLFLRLIKIPKYEMPSEIARLFSASKITNLKAGETIPLTANLINWALEPYQKQFEIEQAALASK